MVELVANRFEIEHEAGRGSMGVVHKAKDRVTGASVALKRLVGGDARITARFAQEAAILAEIGHPAIVGYVAHGIDDSGAPYLAMEWLEGEDLDVRITRGRLSIAETLTLAYRAADALAAAHAAGVVHRDLKPSNLLLPDGDVARVKLLDFGIARAASARQATATGALLGTPAYMAPEQVRGASSVDARADVFALGCVIFECVTGRPAFVGEHAMAVLAKVLLEDPPRLRELVPEAPNELDELVARMLSRDRDQRPADGAAVRAALDHVSLGTTGPVSILPPLSSPTLGSLEKRLVSVVVLAEPRDGDDVESARTLVAGAAHDALREAVAAFGGELCALIDGTMIVTLPSEGSATEGVTRAARCALSLRRRVPHVIALATGRGTQAGHLPLGEVLDRAAGLVRSGASSDWVVTDELTGALLDARFAVEKRDGAYVLHGERDVEGEARPVLGRPTPFVGRSKELSMILGMHRQCVEENRAAVVLVTGPAGIGKSRLREELVREMTGSGEPLTILRARGDAMRAGSPFALVASSLRQAAGLQENEAAAERRRKLQARVAEHVPAVDSERVTEFLNELLGAESEGGSVLLRAARADVMLMADQTRAAFLDFLAAEVAAKPVLIVLDDVQWGDRASFGFVDAALRAFEDAPLFVLAFGRPEVRETFPRLWEDRSLQEVPLRPLVRRATEKLVSDLLGPSSTPERVAAVSERASGNPYFVEELVRALAEQGDDTLPATVLAVVEGRLTALDAEARRVLRAASIFGETFWEGALRALVPDAERDIRAWLDELAERELVMHAATSRFSGEEEHRFRHAFVREAAYAMLTDADRALGHQLAAAWLEASGERDPVAIAEHLDRGGEKLAAARAWLRGAEQALGGGDVEAALGYAERGVRCGATGELLAELRLAQAEAYLWQAKVPVARETAIEALSLASPGSEVFWRAAAHVSTRSGNMGDLEGMRRYGTMLLEPAALTASPHAYAMALSLAVMGMVFNEGRTPLMDRLAERAVGVLSGFPADDPRARLVTARVAYSNATAAGDSLGTMEHGRTMVDALDAIGDRRRACQERTNLAYAHIELGMYEEAEALLRDALAAAQRLQALALVMGAKQNLSLALTLMDQLDEARVLALESMAEANACRGPRMEAASKLYFARIEQRRGDLVAAEREVRDALVLTATVPGIRASAQGMLAELLLDTGRAAEALATAKVVYDAIPELGAFEGATQVRVVYARALLATGQPEAAQRALREAHAHVLAHAGRIADEKVRQSFLATPDNAAVLALAQRTL